MPSPQLPQYKSAHTLRQRRFSDVLGRRGCATALVCFLALFSPSRRLASSFGIAQERERRTPHRTLRCLHNRSRMNNLQEAHNFRHPFHSQFGSGLNHTLQGCLGRRWTLGESDFIPWMVSRNARSSSGAGSGPCSSTRCTVRWPPRWVDRKPASVRRARVESRRRNALPPPQSA